MFRYIVFDRPVPHPVCKLTTEEGFKLSALRDSGSSDRGVCIDCIAELRFVLHFLPLPPAPGLLVNVKMWQ